MALRLCEVYSGVLRWYMNNTLLEEDGLQVIPVNVIGRMLRSRAMIKTLPYLRKHWRIALSTYILLHRLFSDI